MNSPLSTYKVLLADSDRELSKVISDMLAKMGFRNLTATRSGQEAYDIVQSQPVDFLITEWNTKDVDGLSLIQKIRRSPDSKHPTLPIMMLTGRAEEVDVVTARDGGINEYIVKPFSAKAIFSRIERIIEHPRNFVATKTFVGPDRRFKGTPPPGVADRRTEKAQPKAVTSNITADSVSTSQTKIWLPDFALKTKLGKQPLSNFITPKTLEEAQSTVNAIADESLGWIKNDLAQLDRLSRMMEKGGDISALPEEIGLFALSINSRAGTFGYARAAQVAYMLYLFSRNKLQPNNANHYLVVQKHIEVLQVILGHQVRGSAGELGTQIITELHNLTQKYAA